MTPAVQQRGTAVDAPTSETISAGLRALRILTLLRRLLFTAMFVAAVVGGVLLYQVLNPPIDYGTLPPLAEAAEPAAADELTDLVEAGNEAVLAERYSADLLMAVSTALTVGPGQGAQPLVEVRQISYLGSVTDGSDTLALYVAYGRLDGGIDAAAGFALRVRDGQVVGVN